jgi:hypothetical protein
VLGRHDGSAGVARWAGVPRAGGGSIDAHLTIVFAALAVSHWIKNRTGWSIKKFVRTHAATAPSRFKVGGRR